MTYSASEIWFIIGVLAVLTFLIRFSFLGLIGDRPMPTLVMRLLRYTPVAVLPGMVAPLVIWPTATDGVFDPARAAAALAALGAAYVAKNPLWGMVAGGVTLYVGLFATGQL